MRVLVECIGTSALVVNSARGIDRLDPLSKLIDELTHKKPRTDADEAEISHLEWLRCLYHAPDIGIYLPAANMIRCLRNAGNLVDKNKGGVAIQRGLALATDRIPLMYDGPRDLDELYRLDAFRLRGAAKQSGGARVMKTWPVFHVWSLAFEAEMAEEQLRSLDYLTRIAEYAGRYEGLGDERRHGGGRFNVTVAGNRTTSEQLRGARANGQQQASVPATR